MNEICSEIKKGDSIESILDLASKKDIETNAVSNSLILHKSRCLCELKTIHKAIDENMGAKCID